MTGAKIISHRRLKKWIPIFFVLLISEIMFFATEIFKVQLHGPVISLELGVIKDLVDAVSVMLFPWHGTTAMSMHFNFKEPSIINFVSGLFTYLVINLFVFIFIHSLKITFQWVRKIFDNGSHCF